MNALLKISTRVLLSLLCLLFGGAGPATGVQEPSSSPILDSSDLSLPALIREATPPTPPENQRERLLAYAYRTGDSEALLSALDSLIAENQFPTRPSGDLLHFFAALLKGHPDAVEKLARREAAASGDVKEALASIIRAAAEFSSPAPVSPAAVDALWAEYRALGNEATLKAIVNVLKLPPSGESEELVRHAALSLARNVPVHGNLTFLEKSLKEASGGQRMLLRLVFDAVSDRKDAADRHTHRGDNLHTERMNQEAVAEYLAALGEFPAHHPAHTALGRYFEKTGDIPKALWHAEQALLLAGDDPYVLTNLSRVLYRLRRYADAQRSCEKALGNNPSDPYPYYLLGLIHEALHEREKAAAFFAKSLEIEPHGTCSGDARRHLAAMNASAPVSATDLVLLLRQKNFPEIEQQLTGLLESGEKTRDGTSLLYEAIEQIATAPRSDAAYQARLKELEAWLTARPDSHFVYACLGDCYLEYAFFGRGSGWASSVTAEGWKVLQERLQKAQAHLEKAYVLDPSDPAPPAFLIRVAMGLSLEHDEIDKQFKRSAAADKTFCEVYFRKMDYLAPHWHGSPEELLAFARESAANAPPGSSIPRILTLSHWIVRDTLERGRQDSSDYFKDPAIWAELKSAHEKILKAFPDSSKHHNWYAKDAYYAGDYQIARQQFEIIGNEWHAGCWKTYSAFQEAKSKAFAAVIP